MGVIVSIATVDMHIRDQRVLDWLISQHQNEPIRLSGDKVADMFGCHPHTARAILKRLCLAGHLEIVQTMRRGGYVYKVINA